ncbi:MAG: SMC family ATPase [Dehalococcoidia bacterium]|nr:SMC family ATPase [Dehalococcoidia bacterium]
MIPLRLSLRNFMSYRDAAPVLDLEGVRVACLCGDNGHGKSALLDAITWALWGAVRGVPVGTRSLRTDELVHAGQTEMGVALDFLAGETRYRVIRKHGKATRGPNAGTSLDLQVASGAGPDGFRSISEGSIAATQRKLTQILQMDYETFINTSFLLQGQTDRFTRAEPMRRKEILGNILGLSLYDSLAAKGRLRAGEAKARLELAEADLLRLDQDLLTRPQAEAEARQARAGVDALAPRVSASGQAAEAVRLRLALLDRKAQEERRLRQELDRARANLRDLQALSQRVDEQRFAYEAAIARREATFRDEAALQETRRQLEQAEAAFTRHHALQGSVQEHQKTAAVARARLEAQLRAAQERLAELTKAASAAGAQRALDAALTALAALDGAGAALRAREDAFVSLRAEEIRLESEGKALAAEVRSLRDRLALLEHHEDPVCPLCGNRLGPDGLAHLRQEHEQRGIALRQQLDEGQALLTSRRVQLRSLQHELAESEASLLQQREASLKDRALALRGVEEAGAAANALPVAQQGADTLSAQLSSGAFAAEAQQALRLAEAELAALGYKPDLLPQHRQRLAALTDAPERSRLLREAEQRLPSLREELVALAARLSEAAQSFHELEGDLRLLAAELHERPGLEAETSRLASEHQAAQQHLQASQAAVAHCDARLHELDAKERQRRETRQTVRALQDDRASFSLLADAFGRNGLQAMLIDEVLPELEQDANQLLSRLTDGRMTLRLQTERVTRSGEPRETLDLLVGDELGTRSYDLFSGGEAFRINFALRLALARLLARRAGAPLRTLFVDEGFGTQDAAGREHLVEALQSIQSDFDLIIAITHLEEVKEAFPVKIEVTKDERGSVFRLVA